MNTNSNDFAKKLESDYITHISFLMDYLAIGFNSGTLTAFLPPSIISGEKSWHWQQPGFNDKLVSLIQSKVISVDLNEDEKHF